MPITAHADEAPDGTPALAAELRVSEWPRAQAAQLSAFGGAQRSGSEIDYRLWLAAGRASFGFGIGAPVLGVRDGTQPWSAERASAMLVGVGYQLSDRSRVYFDAARLDELPRERDLRMGFEFKPATSHALGVARGTLLRVQWSSQSQLSLRLRSGGLAIALRSQF